MAKALCPWHFQSPRVKHFQCAPAPSNMQPRASAGTRDHGGGPRQSCKPKCCALRSSQWTSGQQCCLLWVSTMQTSRGWPRLRCKTKRCTLCTKKTRFNIALHVHNPGIKEDTRDWLASHNAKFFAICFVFIAFAQSRMRDGGARLGCKPARWVAGQTETQHMKEEPAPGAKKNEKTTKRERGEPKRGNE